MNILIVLGSLFFNMAAQATEIPAVALVCPTSSSGETQTTETGHTFTRIGPDELKKLGVTDTTKFGEAWAEPDSKDGKKGMVWGDIVKKEDGTPRFMNQKNAIAYCKSIGARLPSGWEPEFNRIEENEEQNSDFVRLREYMGATSGREEGYTAQVLPKLIYLGDDEILRSYYFWSRSIHPGHRLFAYYFNGGSGSLRPYMYLFDDLAVRCVVARRC